MRETLSKRGSEKKDNLFAAENTMPGVEAWRERTQVWEMRGAH